MRVRLVDPSAYTPPYDHALASALAAAGADVTLSTSAFAHGEVPRPVGYRVQRGFYRRAPGRPGSVLRRASKLLQHVPGMLAERRAARSADVAHYQWLPVQLLDGALLPRRTPVVLTAHDVLPREAGAARRRAQARLLRRADAVVVHSAHGRERLLELGVEAARVHHVPHGAFAHLAEAPPGPLPAELGDPPGPVVLLPGLLRPYKGADVLLEAVARLPADAGPAPELWIVGMPRMDIAPLRALAERAPGPVRLVERFVSDAELAAVLRRADLVVLPYREIDQSGVLAAALAVGAPLVLSAVGGFPEVAARGAAALVPPGDPAALATEIARLLGDAPARRALGARALAHAEQELSWDVVARRHLEIYREVAAPRRGGPPAARR